MKFLVLVGDGMGDYPREDLDGKTVLQAAYTPNMDWIARNGKGGLTTTIPPGMAPGSDVANLEIIGYDTTKSFTGRAVFEALSMGHHLEPGDVAFRANLVTLAEGVMRDYSAGHIATEEAAELIAFLDDQLGSKSFRFYPGVSYRHLMIWSGGTDTMVTTPPHDIIGREYEPWLPSGEGADTLLGIMTASQEILKDALTNRKRVASGKLPANSIWLWGQGRPLEILTLKERYGLTGGVISAVDLIKGIGVAAGLQPVFVPGATGYVDTNYRGKAEAAIKVMQTGDFAYVHVEAPDEAGHNGDIILKREAIESFDHEVVGTVLEWARERTDTVVIVLCDHRTPVVERTHTREPVPIAYWGPGITPDAMTAYDEISAESGSLRNIRGCALLDTVIGEFLPS